MVPKVRVMQVMTDKSQVAPSLSPVPILSKRLSSSVSYVAQCFSARDMYQCLMTLLLVRPKGKMEVL